MYKNHPKGLFVLFFTEMWERFGFYTVLSIFVLYLTENFHWSEATVGNIYGIFVGTTFFLPLIGGWIADRFLGYGRTILIGLCTMAAGYALLAVPTKHPWLMFAALAVISSGTGLYKANIYVLVGNLYTKSNAALKDAAFTIFYMGINLGAFLGPIAASSIKGLMMDKYHLPLATAYNAGFGAASAGMLLAITIFLSFRRYHKMADYRVSDRKPDGRTDAVLSRSEEKERLLSLLVIFASIIFFWMAYYQNGYTLTLFAKVYTVSLVDRFTFLLFDPVSLLSILALVLSVSTTARKTSTTRSRAAGGAVAIAAVIIMIFKFNHFSDANPISPESFQVFNPLFIIFLTPIMIGMFGYFRKRSKEPSSPGKMAIGMNLEALSFVVMIIASAGLPALAAAADHTFSPVSPYWLISSYFIITVSELFLSPIGLSFVSKVAPPKLKGAMMGGWFAAQAIGSYLSGFVGRFYARWELWQFFLLLVVASLFSGLIVRLSLKRLKRVSGG
jgi:proton-dependent oligopeptide transporter, POT family